MRIENIALCIALLCMGMDAPAFSASPEADSVSDRIKEYFKQHVDTLNKAAEQRPSERTFRKVMAPLVPTINEFKGASLLNRDFVIRQVYSRKHIAAIGYDLKKQEAVKVAHAAMLEQPAPQLNGPTKPTLLRSSFITLRVPFVEEGVLVGAVSLILDTKAVLKEVGISKWRAYRIKSSDGESFAHGELSSGTLHFKVQLPSLLWDVEYLPKNDKQEEEK